MTFQELLDKARQRLDDTVEPYFWSDDELLDYLNQALSIFLTETLLYQEDDALDVPANTRMIQPENPHDTIGVARVKFDDRPLTRVDVSYIVEGYPIHSMVFPAVAPYAYAFESVTKNIYLYPPPPKCGVLTFRRIKKITVTPDMLSNDIPFDSAYALFLIDGICAYAYTKADSEVYNPQQSSQFMAQFRQNIAQVKKDTILNTDSFNMTAVIPGGLL